MFTLLVGMLIVALSTLGFGYALFGRRPVPQPAMEAAPALPRDPSAEALPSSGAGTTTTTVVIDPPRDGRRARDVTITRWVRIRATLLLALTTIGLAAIVGAVLSVVVVAIVFVAT
ncbi:MAG: hypothetical protein ACYC2O_01450 [Microthrixaceae bacterium]